MGKNLEVTGKTNSDSDTCVDAQCNCDIVWSLAQQYTMKQIVTYTPTHNGIPDYRANENHISNQQLESGKSSFLSDYSVRARRIASSYARMYLEEFHLGDKSKIGRFYWVGLGAFASKQVAVTLEMWRLRIYKTRLYQGLGQGNQWLYNDVLPWHYAYAIGADTFQLCVDARDSKQLVDKVQANLMQQKWAGESISKVPFQVDGETGQKQKQLGYFKATPLIKTGFELVKQWESADGTKKPGIAFQHLIAIAQHEQGEVLQGLIYDDPDFARWLTLQHGGLAASDTTALKDAYANALTVGLDESRVAAMAVIRALIPNLQLVLTSEDHTDDPDYLSIAPDRTVLQDYQQRMFWIKGVAKKYHGLMQKRPRHMTRYLQDMAEWGGVADK